MPRLPGRKSTRTTVPLDDDLLVASFIMTHEERFWKRKCVIEGCDHRIGPDVTKPMWATKWQDEVCADQVPAFIVRERDMDTPLGIACPCHVKHLLEQ